MLVESRRAAMMSSHPYLQYHIREGLSVTAAVSVCEGELVRTFDSELGWWGHPLK